MINDKGSGRAARCELSDSTRTHAGVMGVVGQGTGTASGPMGRLVDQN